MLPIQRRQQILEWLQQEEVLAIRTIGERLDVSDMTIYRDIKPLLEHGEIMKTAGGIALYQQSEEGIRRCSYCLKEGESRLNTQLITTSGVEWTCCLHCAVLRYDQIREEVVQVICRDFLQDITMSAKVVTFLLNPDINLNCCHPQVIAFATKKQAEQFQKGFAGELHTFESVVSAINREMTGGCCCKK